MASITNFLNKNLKFKGFGSVGNVGNLGNVGNVGNVLHNQYVLYFFVIMAVIDLMFFASSGDIRSLITLLIVGFLASFFSKNMIVILFTALVITHILKYGTKVSEGMENQEDSVTDSSGNSVPTANSSDKTGEAMTPKKDKNGDITIKDLQGDLAGFTAIQDKLLGAMKEIDPLLTKAEAFIDKYEKYKASNRLQDGSINSVDDE